MKLRVLALKGSDVKLYITSDLHLDHLVPDALGGSSVRAARKEGKSFQEAVNALFERHMYSPLPPSDPEGVLVLAGDLWEAHKMFSYHSISWIAHVCSMFKDVIVVAGNHDLWGKTWNTWHKKAAQLKEEQGLYNLHILENSCVDIGGIRFIGATLWTDMFKEDPFAILDAERVMNDFYCIKGLTVEKWLQTHHKSARYIEHVLHESPDMSCVVVTHHAPCEISVPDAYKGDTTNAYYYSDLTRLMFDNDNLKLWAHGHMHNTSDYFVDKTRVVCYPVGYGNTKPNFTVVET